MFSVDGPARPPNSVPYKWTKPGMMQHLVRQRAGTARRALLSSLQRQRVLLSQSLESGRKCCGEPVDAVTRRLRKLGPRYSAKERLRGYWLLSEIDRR
jgi:hypothetical protein